MSIKFMKGDLLLNPPPIFAHGCNAKGYMGKGIALEIRDKWPGCYVQYKRLCQSNKFKLGDVFIYSDGQRIIYNLCTQPDTNGANEEGLVNALIMMVVKAERLGHREIYLPRIGAGLGGLDWQKIKNTLVCLGNKTNVKLIVVEEYVQGQPLLDMI